MAILKFQCVSFYVCRFGKHFELPLLVQSVIMIATMMAMMHICVEVNTEKGTVVRKLTGKHKNTCIVQMYM